MLKLTIFVKFQNLTIFAENSITDYFHKKNRFVTDIKRNLKLKEPLITCFKTSCFRENLYYDVCFEDMITESYVHLSDFIQECLLTEDDSNLPEVNICVTLLMKYLIKLSQIMSFSLPIDSLTCVRFVYLLI